MQDDTPCLTVANFSGTARHQVRTLGGAQSSEMGEDARILHVRFSVEYQGTTILLDCLHDRHPPPSCSIDSPLECILPELHDSTISRTSLVLRDVPAQKNAIVRTSILSRGGASDEAVGSSKAECGTTLWSRESKLAKTMTSLASIWRK
jgi:hypothetical protein